MRSLAVCVLFLVACGATGSSVVDAAVDGTTDGAAVELDASTCGDGVVDVGEPCDQGAANGTPTSCCTAGCTLAPSTTVCRPAVGACDVEETCILIVGAAGGSAPGACPPDTVVGDGTPCTGDGTGVCNGADTCLAGQCADNLALAGASCSDEPTCNPDVCTAAGGCTDVAAATDGIACTENGGNVCCGAHCTNSASGVCSTCTTAAHGPQRITIIESQSNNAGHTMDSRWHDLAVSLGHTATIVPQTTLDSLANLATTDILIVSSGLIDLPAARRATIDGFAASHRGVYLQAEYQTGYAPNQTLAEIINAHGGAFSWTGTVAGTQDPVAVTGCLADSPEPAPTLTAYWYACAGVGTAPGLRTIHTAPTGESIGWSFCLPGGGLVISNTDQDFIRDYLGNTPAHMRNVLVALADAANCH